MYTAASAINIINNKIKSTRKYTNECNLDDLTEKINSLESEFYLNILNYIGSLDYECVYNVITEINIIENLNYILQKVKDFYGPGIINYNKIKELDTICDINIPTKISDNLFEKCICGKNMEIVSESSELVCKYCGYIKPLKGDLFTNDQIYTQPHQKLKQTPNITLRHYKYWIERIQGIENITFDPKFFDTLHKYLSDYKIMIHSINYDSMRKILQKINYNVYKNNISCIIKNIGGVGPPLLTNEEDTNIKNTFILVMNHYNNIHKTKYKPYYPDFIRRIMQEIFKDNLEKLKIINFIHKQKAETLQKNDLIFKQIVENAGENSGLKYYASI